MCLLGENAWSSKPDLEKLREEKERWQRSESELRSQLEAARADAAEQRRVAEKAAQLLPPPTAVRRLRSFQPSHLEAPAPLPLPLPLPLHTLPGFSRPSFIRRRLPKPRPSPCAAALLLLS